MSVAEIFVIIICYVSCLIMFIAMAAGIMLQIPMFREKYSLHILKKYEKNAKNQLKQNKSR